ncbi:Uncharacterized protein FWK35_00026605 [Aphis craccivora]|uniref:Uncharacterized protein n=1 Tax=Aphis craccivora TaxID=307492 RepID=A0A6G0VT20_APHCR|nr:Uncharacterized protein FWK35_00026605 [Aphis craccivora]
MMGSITAYKNFMDCRLPLEPVITRWGTWLEAALFYSENFSKFKELVSNIEDDAQSVQKVKSTLIETVRDGLKTIENEKGQILYEKFKSVFDKNPGYNILKLYNNSINGNDVNLKKDPAIISCYK